MSSLSKKLILVLIPTVVVLIGCLGLLLFLPDSGVNEVYLKQINIAKMSAENGDYEQAILCYKSAIDEDDTMEEPYLELAKIYFSLNRDEDGLNILRLGISKTKSLSLITLLNEHDGNISADKKNGADMNLSNFRFNSTYADIFSTYTYDKYVNEYTVKSDNSVADIYKITYSQLDAIFEYENTNELIVINPTNNKPYGSARPTMIKLNKLSILLPGVHTGISVDMLKNAGASEIRINDFDKKLNSYTISFEYMAMKFKCACDKNGTIKGDDSYNEIIPSQVDLTIKKVTLKGKIIDATTGKNVSTVNMIIRAGKGVKSGEAYCEATANNGNYSFELAPGDYTIEFRANGYNKEFIEVNIASNKNEIEQVFTLSPSLNSDEIRFVLEWGDTPTDLDSHLEGNCDGIGVNVNFVDKVCSRGGKKIAELDLDDLDGFGPETITLYNTNGRFEYKVHRYSLDGSLAISGATVRIYTSNSSEPIVLTVPDDVDAEWWTVCTVENGVIKNINGKQN